MAAPKKFPYPSFPSPVNCATEFSDPDNIPDTCYFTEVVDAYKLKVEQIIDEMNDLLLEKFDPIVEKPVERPNLQFNDGVRAAAHLLHNEGRRKSKEIALTALRG